MGSHLKYNAGTGHLLKNAGNHLIHECDPCEHCDSGTMGTTYRITIPANTFTGGDTDCEAEFNDTTKDLTVGHPFYAAPCVRALDISDPDEFDCPSADAVVMTFEASLVILDFIFGGGFVRFTESVSAPYDCSANRTVTYDSSSGVVPIDSGVGKTIDIAFLV